AEEQEVEPAVAQSVTDDTASVPAEDEMVEETFETRSTEFPEEPALGAFEQQQIGFTAESEVAEIGGAESTEKESIQTEGDRSASHHVDPLPPAEFRLFGLGGKKKKSDEEPPEPPETPARSAEPARPATASSFSPGSGLVEEEVIEGEEYELHHHQHKADE